MLLLIPMTLTVTLKKPVGTAVLLVISLLWSVQSKNNEFVVNLLVGSTQRFRSLRSTFYLRLSSFVALTSRSCKQIGIQQANHCLQWLVTVAVFFFISPLCLVQSQTQWLSNSEMRISCRRSVELFIKCIVSKYGSSIFPAKVNVTSFSAYLRNYASSVNGIVFQVLSVLILRQFVFQW